MKIIRDLLIVVLFAVNACCGDDAPEEHARKDKRLVYVTNENASKMLCKKFLVKLKDGTKCPVSLCDAEFFASLFEAFSARDLPTMPMQSPLRQSSQEFAALENQICGGLRAKPVLNVEEFVEIFSLSMPFPDPDHIRCFGVAACENYQKNSDLDIWTEKIATGGIAIYLHRYFKYIEEMYMMFRLLGTLKNYADENLSVCIKPRYGRFYDLLTDKSAKLREFYGEIKKKIERMKESGRLGYIHRCNQRIAGHRKALGMYLREHDRLAQLVKFCEKAKEIEREILRNEEEYNAQLDDPTLGIADASGGVKRGSLFINSVQLDGICQLDVNPTATELYTGSAKTEILGMMRRTAKFGSLPADLKERRQRFWAWRKRNVTDDIVIQMESLCNCLKAKNGDELTVSLLLTNSTCGLITDTSGREGPQLEEIVRLLPDLNYVD
ncbi:hypothetical protein THOM_0082 [Trachipleistophora hominis]|uniref:Uncharacterized protein n=1 Tax=Trachipleistophora hominis TaxID=72359 RepID=L7K0C1_TRAHO|nr:hypothetical protein THOM_0082 [Trachipleistophora hominis]